MNPRVKIDAVLMLPDLDQAKTLLDKAAIALEEEEGVAEASNFSETDPSCSGEAAMKEEPQSLFLMGRAHHHGLGGAAVDLPLALAYYSRAAAVAYEAGSPHRAAELALRQLELELGGRPAAPPLSASKSSPSLEEEAPMRPVLERRKSRSLTRLDSAGAADSGLLLAD